MQRLLGVLLISTLVAFGQGHKADRIHRDYVPDAKTAERIAEAVLIGQLGEERVKAQLPLHATNSYGDNWIVQVTEPGPPHIGGGIAVMIDKHSGCIVNDGLHEIASRTLILS
jgi:NTF2 fold immunity protein